MIEKLKKKMLENAEKYGKGMITAEEYFFVARVLAELIEEVEND